MLIALVLILVLIWAAVIWSIYSNFVVFFSNFSESENYHKAYYASISALERWELVTKQRSPWYIWSGGFIMWEWKWSMLSGWSDWSLSWFSYLWDNAEVSSVLWTVNSRTNRIPSEWNGDVEWMLSADDSPNYNMMGYENSEVFLLYYDNSSGNPYEGWSVSQSKPEVISWTIRLPRLLQTNGFWNLNTEESLVWIEWQIPKDDAIVDWQIRWEYSNKPFTIYSTQTTFRNSGVSYLHDSIFRESDINGPLRFKFSEEHSSPIAYSTINDHVDRDTEVTVISEEANGILSMFMWWYDKFEDLFKHSSGVQLRFSLLNLLKTVGSWHHYPFLEYYAEFYGDGGPAIVSDKYYTIDGEWNFKDFQVNTIIRKPTVKETVLSNFTSIF